MKIKKSVFVLTLILIFTATVFTLFSSGICADAYTEEDIAIIFTNNGKEFTPNLNGNVYSFVYDPGMVVNITGNVSTDPEAITDTVIMQDEQICNAIYKAGTYDITVKVTPSSGGGFIPKTFTVEVKKKEVKVEFEQPSLSIYYTDSIEPKLILDEFVAENTKTEFTYYRLTDNTQIEQPQSDGEYWNVGEYGVKATVSGDNFFGEATSVLDIKTSDASIEVSHQYPEITYTKESAGDKGYNIIELLDANVTNTNHIDRHKLVSFIKSGDDYVEQENILIPGTYEYKLFFANGENYNATPIIGTITLKKAETEIIINDRLSIQYFLDFDSENAIKSLLNKDNGYSIFSKETEKSIFEISENFLKIEFFDNYGNLTDEKPTNVGFYDISIKFTGNDYYQESSVEVVVEITSRDISSEITTFGELNFEYGKDYNIEDKFTIPSEYGVQSVIEYKIINSDNEILDDLSEKPLSPGRFMAVLNVVNSEKFYGTKILIFTISKLEIPTVSITVDNLQYTYGDIIDIQVAVENQYTLQDTSITFEYSILGGDKIEGKPVYSGKYLVTIKIENDIYQSEISRELVISKKDIVIKAKDREVTYGNALFTMDEENHYKIDDFIIDGLVKDEDIASVLSSITVYVGPDEYVTNNLNMVVGTYGMKLSGVHSNYNIVDGGCGELKVIKRVLNVKTTSIKQYVGYSYMPVITVDNSVYNDIAENMVYLFEIYYSSENGEVLNSQPTVAGTYKINARVKAENQDCLELKNYLLNFVEGTLTVLNNQKSDSENLIILEGKFDVNTTLTVKTVSANDAIENAIKSVDKKYEASKLYFIQYTFNTVDNSTFTLKLNRRDIDINNAKVMIGYNTDTFEEVSYTVQGDYIVIRLQNMASYYAICTPHKLPLVWIIVIVVAVVLVLAGVGILLWVYFTGANVKARKNETTLSSAVKATQGVKTEDEEFDELLESFDESTVVKVEDPAKRISRQTQEEERDQYRLRLRRMRASTDKNTSDKLKELGLDSDFDEEKAIDQLMEEDRRKRAQKEAEEARIKAEEEKRKQQETSFTINQRKGGNLSGAGMPVKPKNVDIDDDIDV